MIIIDVEQGSAEWLQARAGLATSSEFSSILAKGHGKTRASYLRKVAAERLTGKPSEHFKFACADRGHELEPLARMEYTVRTGNEVEQVGMLRHDDLMAACSPDGLVFMDGGVEIKSVIPTTQMDTILAGGYPTEHKAQIQGNLWISGRGWWDFVSYCPEMPEHLQVYIFRVMPDREYIATLETEVRSFLDDVDALIARLPKATSV